LKSAFHPITDLIADISGDPLGAITGSGQRHSIISSATERLKSRIEGMQITFSRIT
jgi:hypothetical protein